MKATKRTISIMLTAAIMLTTLLALMIPTSAATRSNGIQTQTITVTTKANWLYPGAESITLSQTKGLLVGNAFSKKSTWCYGNWDIVAKSTDGKHTVKAELNNGSVKIKLKPDKTYNITVAWDSDESFFRTVNKGGFISYPTWTVKSTHKATAK
jgi:hypothetical protein